MEEGKWDIILHIGCGDRRIKGYINSDKNPYSPDTKVDITETWPYYDGYADGIVAISVFQCLPWRDLITSLKESHRVLRKGGVMRIGIPTIDNGKSLGYLLGWNNINLFNYNLLSKVLLHEDVGYTDCRMRNYRESNIKELVKADNRPEQIFYMEATK